jgi:DNA processing protein
MVSAERSPDPTALWLCQMPGMTAALLNPLLAAFGSADAILRASSGALRKLGVAPALVAQIVAGPRQIAHVAAGLKGLRRLGIVPLPFAAPGYPDRLKTLSDPPLVVYVQGAWPLPQRCMLVVPPSEPEPKVAQQWAELAAAFQPHVAFASLAAMSIPDLLKPQLLAVPYGLMLARQRLPKELSKQVAAGSCTLISACPPTAQPDPSALQQTSRMLVTLADTLVLLLPVPAEAEDLVATARSVNVPVFAVAATARAPLPPQASRLRSSKSGMRALSAALGVHLDGATTVQQERLF